MDECKEKQLSDSDRMLFGYKYIEEGLQKLLHGQSITDEEPNTLDVEEKHNVK